MRWLAMLAVVVVSALMSPTAASAYSFGDWARDEGYEPGDAMPMEVWAASSSIDSLDGISGFDWTATPTEELRLNANQLSGIELGALSGLTKLENLYLSDNQLSSIQSGTFSGLTSLTNLYLAGNQLSTIESNAFGGLSNLMTLNLYHNQLSSIEAGAFSGLTHLQRMWLFSNQLSSLEPGDFSGLTELTELWLAGNQLSSIEAGAFGGLTELMELTLGGNQLSNIESGDFSGLANLTSLDLSSNQLSSIESGAFSELTALTSLGLGANQLTAIESGTFSGPTKLAKLTLDGNRLTGIEAGAFSGLANLRQLYLSNNTELQELNLAEADFSSLEYFDVNGNASIGRVLLANSVMNQTSVVALFKGSYDAMFAVGIGELPGITELDLSGIDFANITDLSPLYVMDDLTDLWLVDTVNLDATDLDVLLDSLETIKGTATEGVLYLTQADFDAFNVSGWLADWDDEPGHHVTIIPEPSTAVLAMVALLRLLCWRPNRR